LSSANGTAYKREYSENIVYKTNDIVHYNNHFFISVIDDNIAVMPNVNNFSTDIDGEVYWVNINYSSKVVNDNLPKVIRLG
jgi:hypothetical protein